MAIFYFIYGIDAAETIEGGKLFKGGNYLRKYGIFAILAPSDLQPLHYGNGVFGNVYLGFR